MSRTRTNTHGLPALVISAIALACALSAVTPATAQNPPESSPTDQAQPADARELVEAFSDLDGLEASFAEEKHIGLLARPIRSSGRLYYTTPPRLARHTESPRRSSVVISPGRILVREDGRSEVLELGARPDAQAFVESLLWLFSGNYERLSQAFSIEFESEVDGWRLRMEPRSEQIGALISELIVAGSGYRVRTVTVRESSGDESVMTIADADPNRTYSDDELERIFGASGDDAP